MMDMFIILIVVTVSQYILITDHQVVYLNYMLFLFVNSTSVKLGQRPRFFQLPTRLRDHCILLCLSDLTSSFLFWSLLLSQCHPHLSPCCFFELAGHTWLRRFFSVKYQIFPYLPDFCGHLYSSRSLSLISIPVHIVCYYMGLHGARFMKGNNICRNSQELIVGYINTVPFL